MPFDEDPPDDGGGGRGDGPSHDPERIAHVVETVMQCLDLNIHLNGLCHQHTNLAMVDALCERLRMNFKLGGHDGQYVAASMGRRELCEIFRAHNSAMLKDQKIERRAAEGRDPDGE